MAQGNIQQYTSPIDQIHPSEVGADALAQAGRHIGAEYKEVGQEYGHAIDAVAAPVAKIIDQHETLNEISQGSAALAAMHNNLTTQWNAMASKADPNDKSIQGTFLNDTVEPQLQQWQSSFSTEKGQDWALAQADSMRMHYTEKTAADMSILAGTARVKNLTTQLSQLSNVAYNDPSSINQSFAQVDSTLAAAKENSDGIMTPEQLTKLDSVALDMKNEMTKNAIKGYADSDNPNGPKAAKAILNSPDYNQYLKPKEQQKLGDYIDNQSSARDVEQQQKVQQQQAQQTAANQQEVKGIFSQIASGQGYLATQAFANQKLSTQQKNDLVAQKNGILSLPQDFLTSPAYGDGFSKVAQGVYSGQPITARALTAGVRRQEITPAGAVQLQAISDKMKTPEGLAEVNAQTQVLQQMKTQIIKGGPNAADPAGEKIYNGMLNSFYASWDAGIKSGLTPAQMADPQSKDYIGNMANTFKRSDAQALADVTSPAPAQKATIPPPDKRPAGLYQTPRGEMRWDGKAWFPNVPAAAATPSVPKPE